MDRTVGAELGITAHGECEVELQLAVARTPGLEVTDELTIVHEGRVLPTVEVGMPHEGHLHLVTLPPGFSQVTYSARVRGTAEIPEPSLADLSLYRRPSRYIQSDTFGGAAGTSSTRPPSHRAPRSCGSRRGATRPTRRSCPPTPAPRTWTGPG